MVMIDQITEAHIEDTALTWFEALGYQTIHGPDIAPGELFQERTSYSDVVLEKRLGAAIERINPVIPADAREEALRKVLRTESPSLFENNRRFHQLLVDGVDVEFQGEEGRIIYDKVWLADFEHTDNNDWLVVNQFTVIEDNHNRRPDMVVFLNGLPVGVIELKNPADENAIIRSAYNQLQTYKEQIGSLFTYNELLVVADGVEARAGTLTSNWEWFLPWRTIDGKDLAPKGLLELEVLVKGLFSKERLLDIIRDFITIEVDGTVINKKMAAYHQYYAVKKAVECTVQAASPQGDKRAGVIWHTQGSGKSLSMVFFAGKIIRHPDMANPTLVMLTDRNDLDEQLFNTFAASQGLLRQEPRQAESRPDLRKLLKVASGGVVFTTIQKFFPEQKGDQYPLLSDRRNIVFIVDEAHRSQYDFIDGFARHMRDALPNASFIGFTGTPIELQDKSTPAVFGDYIDIYDIQRAVDDGATVPIYYEGRLAKIEMLEKERPRIDPEFEEVTEGEEPTVKERLKSKWARLEAMVGTDKRIGLVAGDIVNHFEQRLDAMEGKAMIVCMSRRIAVELYKAITKLKPHWHHDDDKKGFIKVVMTGSASDPLDWQPHVRNKPRREALAKRFKDKNDPMRFVIVRDMWLTGFDVPHLHTMYLDKPMRGHTLMQAIARVNRVFGDKQGGLVVDYLGIADQLKKALSHYTEGDRDHTGIPQDVAVGIMKEKYEVVAAFYHGFDYSAYLTGSPEHRLSGLPPAMEHILGQEDGKKRYNQAVTELSRAFALAVPHEDALAIRDEVGFFQAVRAAFIKATPADGTPQEDLDLAVRQIVSKAVAADKVIDIFSAAGLKHPDISILSDEFLEEVRNIPYKNLAIEALKKLLSDEIKTLSRRNLVQSRSFAAMLEESIIKYQNHTIEAAQVIAELINLAKDMRAAHTRGEDIGLSEDELAFYDALEVNDSAVKILGDKVLRAIAHELVETVRRNATIDWSIKESARAKMRTVVKRLLRKHNYPPDKQEKATQTVIEQAELLSLEWATRPAVVA